MAYVFDRRHRARGGIEVDATGPTHTRDAAPLASDLPFEIAPGVMADILSRLEEPPSLYRVRFAPGVTCAVDPVPTISLVQGGAGSVMARLDAPVASWGGDWRRTGRVDRRRPGDGLGRGRLHAVSATRERRQSPRGPRRVRIRQAPGPRIPRRPSRTRRRQERRTWDRPGAPLHPSSEPGGAGRSAGRRRSSAPRRRAWCG